MKIISQVIFFYSIYHIINNFNCLIFKKVILKHIRFFFIVLIFFNIYLREISFRKYKNSSYYADIINKCILENFHSFIIFIFWILLNISEENNQILLILSKKRNNRIKNYNIYKFETKNEIKRYNYSIIKSNLNIAIYKKYPLMILNPFFVKINNDNFKKISIGLIE